MRIQKAMLDISFYFPEFQAGFRFGEVNETKPLWELHEM